MDRMSAVESGQGYMLLEPLTRSMTHPATTRRERVLADLRERGFDLTDADHGTVARDGPPITSLEAPLFVTEPRDTRPLTTVSTVAAAARDGYVPLLITDDTSISPIERVLEAPFLLASAGDGRQFFTIEDRIQLTNGTYACAARGALDWAERATDETDFPELVLRRENEIVTVLESVEALTCPGPSPAAFPYQYTRGADGQFRVLDGDDVVTRYPSMTALRTEFQPVPLPLVPEHHIRTSGRLARATMLAVVGDGVAYKSP